MWNAPKNAISEGDIRREHFHVLRKAIADAGEFDPRTTEVYAALDYLQKQSSRTWGFTLFKEGLERNELPSLQRGLALIRQHLGSI
jgi:hypothetical protein